MYVAREVGRDGGARAAGFVPRRVVEHLEGPRAGASLLAMYEAADVGGAVTLPGSGVAVGLGTAVGGEDGPAMAWGASAWAWLDERVAGAEAAWGAHGGGHSGGHSGARWVWPRVGEEGAAEVLSDVPSLRRFLKEREGGGWRFVLDPVGMLAESMMGNAEEHVRRVLEVMGSHEACGAVVLADVAMDAKAGRGGLAPVGAGELTRRGLLEWWRGNCPATLPVILGCDRSLGEQVGWLTSG